jgi:DNA-binding MarR family transcriptional regulator
LIDALVGTARQVAYSCDVRASGAHMTAVQARTAAHVARYRYGTPCATLVELLGVSKQAVTGLVARMEYSELVVRGEHPLDRRCTVVRLTEHGAAELAEVSRRLAAFDRELRRGLGIDRCAQLRESLRVIATEPWAPGPAAFR